MIRMVRRCFQTCFRSFRRVFVYFQLSAAYRLWNNCLYLYTNLAHRLFWCPFKVCLSSGLNSTKIDDTRMSLYAQNMSFFTTFQLLSVLSRLYIYKQSSFRFPPSPGQTRTLSAAPNALRTRHPVMKASAICLWAKSNPTGPIQPCRRLQHLCPATLMVRKNQNLEKVLKSTSPTKGWTKTLLSRNKFS